MCPLPVLCSLYACTLSEPRLVVIIVIENKSIANVSIEVPRRYAASTILHASISCSPFDRSLVLFCLSRSSILAHCASRMRIRDIYSASPSPRTGQHIPIYSRIFPSTPQEANPDWLDSVGLCAHAGAMRESFVRAEKRRKERIKNGLP